MKKCMLVMKADSTLNGIQAVNTNQMSLFTLLRIPRPPEPAPSPAKATENLPDVKREGCYESRGRTQPRWTFWSLEVFFPSLLWCFNACRKHGISYHNTKIDCWSAHYIPLEAALKDSCRLLLCVITEETRAMTSMIEVCQLNHHMVLINAKNFLVYKCS